MRDELFSEVEQKYLSAYFSQKSTRLGVSKMTTTDEIKVFEKKLNDLAISKKSNFYNWKTFAGSVVSAFSLGAVIANLTVTPVIINGARSIQLKQNVTESDRLASAVTSPDKVSSTTTISGDKLRLPGSMPAWLQIVQLASSGAEEVIVEPIDNALRIRIFLPKDRTDQALALKVALGLRPDVSGWITVNFSSP